uniref:Myb_DNA-bind_5 domain-containing protein n=1 Tax=Panagrellus redivivus TaxID=6233 RepID=A0A7E4V286_PANRE
MKSLSTRRSYHRKEEKLYFLEILDTHYRNLVTPAGMTTDWATVLKECHREGVLRDVTNPRYLSRTKWPQLIRTARTEFNSNRSPSAISKKVIAIVQKSDPSFCQSPGELLDDFFIQPPMDDLDYDFEDFPEYDADYLDGNGFEVEETVGEVVYALVNRVADENPDPDPRLEAEIVAVDADVDQNSAGIPNLVNELVTRVANGIPDEIHDFETQPLAIVATPEAEKTAHVEELTKDAVHSSTCCHCPAHLQALQAITEFNKAQTELVRLKIEKLRRQMI